MSIAELDSQGDGLHQESPQDVDDSSAQRDIPPIPGKRAYHRLRSVRRQQGVSLRNVARRLRIDVDTARDQENESCDLPLSVLYLWQQVLEVPAHELLVDDDLPLSPPVLARARMVKLMKTAAAILEKATTASMRRMVMQLMEQLLEIMPELKDVGPWHALGQQRSTSEYGRVMEHPIPEDFYRYD